jgi:hypothetical protein
MKKTILILATLLTLNVKSQEIKFEERNFNLPEYALTMAIPIIAFEVLSKSDRDKKYHFEAGYVTNATVGYFLKKHTDNIALQIIGSLASGILINYAKEYIWDKELGRGTFNQRDINAGGWGSNMAMFSYLWAIRKKGTVEKPKYK